MQTGGYPPVHCHTAEDAADVKRDAATCEALDVLRHFFYLLTDVASIAVRCFMHMYTLPPTGRWQHGEVWHRPE